MIKFKNIRTISSLLIGALLVTSCENSDLEIEKDFEDLDIPSAADTSNDTEPVFTMHFDAGLSEEEVKIEFEKEVESYLKEQESTSLSAKSNGFSTEWYTRLFVWTGTGTDEGTDGAARTSLWFDTSEGRHRTHVTLDNAFDSTERQGSIDAYLIRSSIEDTPVETVSVTNAFLYLTGTDNWFVTQYNAYVFPTYQTTESTGASWLTMEPNVWLVSDTATGSDLYSTGRETGYSGNGLQFEGVDGVSLPVTIDFTGIVDLESSDDDTSFSINGFNITSEDAESSYPIGGFLLEPGTVTLDLSDVNNINTISAVVSDNNSAIIIRTFNNGNLVEEVVFSNISLSFEQISVDVEGIAIDTVSISGFESELRSVTLE